MDDSAFVLIGYCSSALSFFLGLVVIRLFWKDKISRLIGCYAVKPFIIHSIGFFWIIQLFYNNYDEFIKLIEVKTFGFILYLIMEFILSAVIVYFFRDLFSRQKVSMLLPVLDAFQWIAFALIDYRFYLSNFAIAPYRLIWLLIYPVIALVVGIIRAKNKKLAISFPNHLFE
jgi:hypothetical protein